MVANLERAIEIATVAHEGQTRFDDSPYINHPLRVMRMLEIQGHSEIAQIVGVLHDVVEDTDVTLDLLRQEGFNNKVLHPLELLTKQPGEDYEIYLQRASANACSRAVKKDDVFDNSNLDGLENPSKKRILMMEKYGRALLYLARFPQPRV